MLDKLTTKETKEIIIFSKEFKRKKRRLNYFLFFLKNLFSINSFDAFAV
jgi:negative regulator of replication initiation